MAAETNLRRVVELIIDVASGKIVDNSNISSTVPEEEYDWGSQILFRVQLRRNGSAFEVQAGTIFYFCIDNTFSTGSADLVSSLNDQFNLTGDWSEFSLPGGKISWRTDLASATLKTALGTEERKVMYAELWMQAPGASYSKIGRWRPWINNSVADIIGTATPVGPTYATIDALNARIGEGILIENTPAGGIQFVRNGVVIGSIGP